jgi:hypothetical protein
MNTRTDSRFHSTLQNSVGELVERAVAAPAGAERSRLLRWLLATAAVFVAWRLWRGFKSLFWTLFGLAMAFYWSGGWLLWRQ